MATQGSSPTIQSAAPTPAPVQNKQWKNMLMSSLIGMGGTLLVSPIQFPLECVKANWQTNPHIKHELAVGRMIAQTKGFNGFYSGYLTNCFKQVSKSSYRYPLIASLPKFYAKMLGTTVEKNKYKLKLMTSFSVTAVEATLITPLERLQVFAMTSQNSKKNYSAFYNEVKSNWRTELFKGYTPFFCRQVVAWTSLLLSDAFYKNQIRKFWKIPDDQMITGWKLFLCMFLVAGTTILISMPMDNIKTFLQKNSSEMRPGGNTKQELGKIKISDAMRRIYKRGGVLGFFVGWRLKMCTYFTTTSLSVSIIEWMDNKDKKSNN